MKSILAFASFVITWAALANEPTSGNGVSACVAKAQRDRVESTQTVYEKNYDAFIEVCAASQWMKRGEDDGGNFGHAVAMIRGAKVVQDPATNTPRLVADPKSTACVSTDAQLHNAQWMGTGGSDGRDFCLYGGHPADKPFTEAAWERVNSQALARGMVGNVRWKDWNAPELRKTLAQQGKSQKEIDDAVAKEWAARFASGTDFALATARALDCARVPLVGTNADKPLAPLEKVINYFNRLNAKAAQAPDGYLYQSAVNNCSVTVEGAVVELGLLPKKSTEGNPESTLAYIQRRNDISSPYNLMFDTYKASNLLNLNLTSSFSPRSAAEAQMRELSEIKRKLRRDKNARDLLEKDGWLPFQDGVTVEQIDMLAYQNEVYEPKKIFALFNFGSQIRSKLPAPSDKLGSFKPRIDLKEHEPTKREFLQATSDKSSKAFDLEGNLGDWKNKYKNFIEIIERTPRGPQTELDRKINDALLAHFKSKLSRVEAMLQKDLKPKAPSSDCAEPASGSATTTR